jgi:hypothetical protein
MPVKSARSRTAAGLAVAALTAAGAGCSGSAPASPASSSPSSPAPSPQRTAYAGQRPVQAPPAGYTWAGSSSQRLWVAIPRAWVALNLANVSLSQAARRFSTTGIASSALLADLATLKKQKALFLADPASARTSAHGFTTNASALCQSAGSGAGGLPGLEAAMRIEYASIKAHVQSIKPVPVTGGQAFEARLAVTASAGYDITELQVVVLSTTGRTCFVTFSTDDLPAFLPVFGQSAATIHVG